MGGLVILVGGLEVGLAMLLFPTMPAVAVAAFIGGIATMAFGCLVNDMGRAARALERIDMKLAALDAKSEERMAPIGEIAARLNAIGRKSGT